MGEVVNPSQDICSPLYVSSSDNPCILVIFIILEGLNYHYLSRLFQMSLISKNKIGFIDGTIEALTHTSLLFPAWEMSNIGCFLDAQGGFSIHRTQHYLYG